MADLGNGLAQLQGELRHIFFFPGSPGRIQVVQEDDGHFSRIDVQWHAETPRLEISPIHEDLS
jgi:hypothetical protein